MGAQWSDTEWNGALNRYYAEKVKLSREETRQAVAVVTPILQSIVREISRLDPCFDCQPHHAGSYSQGLKVARMNEFDVNVKILGLEGLQWRDLKTSHQRTYRFSDAPVNEDPAPSFPADRDIECVNWLWYGLTESAPLKQPPKGHCFVNLERSGVCRGLSDAEKALMVRNEDLIPYLVKKRFKQLLTEAITNLSLRENRLLGRARVHGPALTVRISSPELKYPIDVDFVPIIEASLSMDGLPTSWFGPAVWPRRSCQWPSANKVRMLKSIGISLVAKKNFYWIFSFGRMEQALVDCIDEDGGCRKQVHRISKKMLSDIWCPTTKPVISSYHLKNVLFWECEDKPLSSDWHIHNLSQRFLGVVKRLRRSISERHLPLYFYPEVNLLEGKKLEDLDLVGRKIDNFLDHPDKFIPSHI